MKVVVRKGIKVFGIWFYYVVRQKKSCWRLKEMKKVFVINNLNKDIVLRGLEKDIERNIGMIGNLLEINDLVEDEFEVELIVENNMKIEEINKGICEMNMLKVKINNLGGGDLLKVEYEKGDSFYKVLKDIYDELDIMVKGLKLIFEQ